MASERDLLRVDVAIGSTSVVLGCESPVHESHCSRLSCLRWLFNSLDHFLDFKRLLGLRVSMTLFPRTMDCRKAYLIGLCLCGKRCHDLPIWSHQ